MSAKCFVALSKFGDIIQALQIIESEYRKSHVKPVVITSEKYASVFHGVGYVHKVIIYSGRWGDLHGAIKFGKAIYNDVTPLQCHGENFPFKQTRPSFQHEVYERAGVINEWPNSKPNFDRRDRNRENALIKGHGLDAGRKFILVADQSESSQFKQVEELKSLIASKFAIDYRIIMLSSIKAEKIYDLIGIYERAAALVTTESVHTHLAWATSVPMFVLAANGWRGSAHRRQFKFYMKYADWDRRKNDLISALHKFLYGEKDAVTTTFTTTRKFGYNLASIDFNGHPVYAYRHHFGNWKTNLVIRVGGSDFPLQVHPDIANHSHEDLRFFIFNEKLHGIYTVAAETNGGWRCYQAYGEITNDADGWRIGHIRIKYPGNDFTGLNKNWVPFIYDGKIHLIYGIKDSKQAVLQVDGNEVRFVHHSAAPRWDHGEIRGGVIIPHGDTLLRFFHSRAEYADKTFCYFVGCCTMASTPPFKTLKICSAPVLRGDDEFTPNCSHWKGNVVFSLGAIQQDDKILLSFGHNDCESRIVKLSEEDLKL